MIPSRVTEVWFQVDKRGKRRAYYYSVQQFRSFPLPLAEAELAVATGQVREVPGHPFPKAVQR